MKTILEKILADKRQEIAAHRKKVPLKQLRDLAAAYQPKSFKGALKGFGIIAEIKAKSPSMGKMDPANVRKAIGVYDASPAVRALSVLTDKPYFGGSLEKLREYRRKTVKPILRKDFTLDEYQAWEAKACGADAILLMASVHRKDPSRLRAIYDTAVGIGLDVLIEFGEEAPPAKPFIPKGASLFGINSRTFKASTQTYRRSSKLGKASGNDLTTNLQNHFGLLEALHRAAPGRKTVVAESGLQEPADLEPLIRHGFSAALIGTAFLRKGGQIGKVMEGYDAFMRKRRAP